MMNPDLTTTLICVRKLIGLTVFRRIRAFIEQDNLLASSTALSLAKLAVEYHTLSILTHMRDYESENVRVARHLHGQFSSLDQRTFYGSQNGPKMCICGKAVCARSHLSVLDRPLKQSLGQVMVSTRGQESRRITAFMATNLEYNSAKALAP
jgi:hypothetical protein